MWDLPRPGLEPVSPALAGRFSTTALPGKPSLTLLYLQRPYFQVRLHSQLAGVRTWTNLLAHGWTQFNPLQQLAGLNTPTNSPLYDQVVKSRCFFFSPSFANWVSGQGPYQTASRQCRSCLGPVGASRLANSCCPPFAWFWGEPVWPCSALGWGQTGAGGHCNPAPCRTKIGPHHHAAEATGQRMQLGTGAECISQRCMERMNQLHPGAHRAPSLQGQSRGVERVSSVPLPAKPACKRRQPLLWSPPNPLSVSLTL